MNRFKIADLSSAAKAALLLGLGSIIVSELTSEKPLSQPITLVLNIVFVGVIAYAVDCLGSPRICSTFAWFLVAFMAVKIISEYKESEDDK